MPDNEQVLDCKKVWQAALQDSLMTHLPPEVQRCYKTYIVQLLPYLLQGWLTRGVTLEVVINAKVAVVRYQINNSFFLQLARAYPDTILKQMGITSQELSVQMQESAKDYLEDLRSAREDVAKYRRGLGYGSEQTCFATPNSPFVLVPFALVEYRACTLTLRKLLEVYQPGLVLFP